MTICARKSAFTLVEILIVVLLLGILAALVIPKYSSAAEEARTNSLKMNLFQIRTQLEVYKQGHGNHPSLDNFADQMTKVSNPEGDTAEIGTPGFYLGPYLQSIPNNPNTGTNDISAGEVGSSAWYYDESVGHFQANDSEANREF